MIMPARAVVLVHGGAGDIPDSRVEGRKIGVQNAARCGYSILERGGSPLDAVQAAVRFMEDDPIFNAGTGSVLNIDGEVEMDAAVMEGTTLRAGAVAALRNVQHPIDVARLVMEKTNHILLTGIGAKRFANEQCVPDVSPDLLITLPAQRSLAFKKKHHGSALGEAALMAGGGENEAEEGVGTVGAVAVDAEGHVAVATSTGGTTGKMAGRVGDTPMIGCGSYCDDSVGAVSATGHGESIIRVCLARHILNLMEQGKSAFEATRFACEAMSARVGNTAGAITISNKGDVGISFTSDRMSWAYQQGNELHYGVDRGEDNIVLT